MCERSVHDDVAREAMHDYYDQPREAPGGGTRQSETDCDYAGHDWADAGGGLLICVNCQTETWGDDDRGADSTGQAGAGSNRVTPGEAARAGSGADHENAGAGPRASSSAPLNVSAAAHTEGPIEGVGRGTVVPTGGEGACG